MKSRPKISTLAAAAFSLLCGCAQVVDHTIAGAIKKALPSAIGPAQNYTVTVNSDPLQAAQGHLKRVDIVGDNVQLSHNLLLQQLHITATNIEADPQTRKVTSVGEVVFSAEVNQDDVDRYLASQPDDTAQKREKLSVELNPSSITASIVVRTVGLSIPASVTGSFQIDPNNAKYIEFIPSSGSLSILPVPLFALKLALHQINPVIDLTDSTVPVNLESVAVQSNVLVLSGSADLQQGLVQGT